MRPRMSRGILLGLAGWLAAGGALATLPPAPTLAEPAPEPAVADQALADAWISTRIKAVLVPLVREGRADVRVEVRAGTVLLTGTVDGELTRRQLHARCLQLPGVVAVDDSALALHGLAPLR